MEGNNNAAKPDDYDAAAIKIAVWWDMNDCPIPEGYDARRVRPSIERRLEIRGCSGPISITAYGDQAQTPGHLLRGLSSTGVVVAHTNSESTCSLMFSDMLEWRARNPPPATMMLISNQVGNVFSWDLSRLQQETKYNLFLAFSRSCHVGAALEYSGKWRWKNILGSADEEIICRETGKLSSAMFNCKSCKVVSKSVVKFRRHLSSTRHALEEIKNPTNRELDPVTKRWGRNYPAKPEYATAKIAVWWDMIDCPIPEGYDPRRVRPSMEGAFKKLGYSGPVSITAYADQTQTPEHILRGLYSTGVDVAHTNSDVTWKCLFSDLFQWRHCNPPPATMMVITNGLEYDCATGGIVGLQQLEKYNLFLAYSYRPYKMPMLVTSAEWLWESLLDVSLVSHHHPEETGRHVLQKCSGEGGQSTGMFYCKSCDCDCKSLDNFREHLSSEEHAFEETCIDASIKLSQDERTQSLEDDYFRSANFPRSKRSRKAFRTGFRHFHNHLHLTNRRSRSPKSLTLW